MRSILVLVLACVACLTFSVGVKAQPQPVPNFGAPFNGLISRAYYATGQTQGYLQGIPNTIQPVGVAIAAYEPVSNQLALNLYDSTGTILQDFNLWNNTGYYYTIGPEFLLTLGVTPQAYQANLAQLLLSGYSYTTTPEFPFIVQQALYVGLASDPTSPDLLADYFTVNTATGVYNGWTFTDPFLEDGELLYDTTAITLPVQRLWVSASDPIFKPPASLGQPTIVPY